MRKKRPGTWYRAFTALVALQLMPVPVLAQESRTTTIFVAKKILTLERGNPAATAVAVVGTRVVAVGSFEQVKAVLGDETVSVDRSFESKILVPGFIDQHLHPILAASSLATEVIAPEDWVLPDRTFAAATTPQQYASRLEAAEAALKKGEWLFSWGYHALWHGKLDRARLDAVSATRPIVVWQRSCHELFLNSAAIQALALDEAPMKGHGLASEQMSWEEGHWWESGTNLILAPIEKALFTPERLVFGLRQLIAYLHQNGVTAFNDPGVTFTPESWKLYQAMLGAEGVPFYTTFLPDARMQAARGVEGAAALAEAEALCATAPSGKVSCLPKQIKLFADGAILSQLMQMRDGYLGGDGKLDPSHQGEWLMTPTELEKYAKLYWDADYQLHIHVNGDLGLDTVLDMLERRMRENARADHRTVIVHFANSTEAQVGRIARLGAIVSANPYYAVGFADMYGRFGLGPKRADAMVRLGSVRRHDVPLSFHSDLPMAPAAPLYLAWAAVNRLTPAGRVAGPEQRIGVEDALRAVTIEAAYSWRKEHDLGSIAPGKIANFTVLEQDPLAIDLLKLKDVPIWGTVFEGKKYPR